MKQEENNEIVFDKNHILTDNEIYNKVYKLSEIAKSASWKIVQELASKN